MQYYFINKISYLGLGKSHGGYSMTFLIIFNILQEASPFLFQNRLKTSQNSAFSLHIHPKVHRP